MLQNTDYQNFILECNGAVIVFLINGPNHNNYISLFFAESNLATFQSYKSRFLTLENIIEN